MSRIISASRRTDIPAFYGPWLSQRLAEGCVLVRNPQNSRQVSRISLDPADVAAFVFWTKNAQPFLPVLEYLDRQGYAYGFQYTLNDYPSAIEPGLPPVGQRLDALLHLSGRLGPARLIWRYDPIIFAHDLTSEWHLERFDRLARSLAGLVRCCVLSFVDDYRKIQRKMRQAGLQVPEQTARQNLVAGMARVARQLGLPLQTCCEEPYPDSGVLPAACISREWLTEITGRPLPAGEVTKDPGQRPACRCIQATDIGAYDTCRHGCVYCYAGGNADRPRPFFDECSPLLGRPLGPADRVTDRRT